MSTVTNGAGEALRNSLKKACEARGLAFLGTTGLDYPDAFIRFESWLAKKFHGSMSFLERHTEVRRSPAKLLAGARSVAVVAMPYYQPETTSAPRVAQYARFPDYHRVLRHKLSQAAAQCLEPGSFRAVVDSAPLLERALAARTARGFIGKNTLFIHPEKGSFLLLGELLVTVSLPEDVPAPIQMERKTREGGCGPCRQCQVACPTGALNEAYRMDATRCLSYWTIEHRGTIPTEFWPYLAEYYFGCDLCQLACPYNKRPASPPSDFVPRPVPPLEAVAKMSQSEYEAWFGGTPLTRAKRFGLRRNALVAMAVTRHPCLPQAVAHVQADPHPVLEQTVAQIEMWQGAK